MFRYIAFALGAAMLLPLSVLSAMQGSNRMAIFYGLLLILLFVICLLNPFLANSGDGDEDPAAGTPGPVPPGSNSLPPAAPPVRPAPERASVPEFSRDPAGAGGTGDPGLRSPDRPAAPAVTSSAPTPQPAPAPRSVSGDPGAAPTRRPAISPAQMPDPASLSACGSIDSILMGSLDRKVEIRREEKDGYLTQITIITERSRIECSETTRTLRELGLNAALSEDDDYPEYRRYAGTRIQPENSGRRYRKILLRPAVYTFRMLKHILILTGVCILLIIAAWQINSLYSRERTRTTFQQIIRSLDPVKRQVEECIKAEGQRYRSVCNDRRRSSSGRWDLSDSYISSVRDPNVSAVRVDGGTITAYTNYDHELRGTSYITVPAPAPEGGITWIMDPASTCLKTEICADESRPRRDPQ